MTEINPQMPSDLEAWEHLLQTDSAVGKSWPEWEGPCAAGEVEGRGIGGAVRVASQLCPYPLSFTFIILNRDKNSACRIELFLRIRWRM